MHFTSAIFAAVTLTGVVLAGEAPSAQGPTDGFAVMAEPSRDYNMKPGSSYEIKWDKGDSEKWDEKTLLDIELLGGDDPKTLDAIETISGKTFGSSAM